MHASDRRSSFNCCYIHLILEDTAVEHPSDHTSEQPQLDKTTSTHLGVSVLVDSDISHSPSLPTILRLQITRSASHAQRLAVAGVLDVHVQGGIEIVVLRDGAAFD